MLRFCFHVCAGIAAAALALPAYSQSAGSAGGTPDPANPRTAPASASVAGDADSADRPAASAKRDQGRNARPSEGTSAGAQVTGTGAAGSGAEGLVVECRPSAPDCPVTEGEPGRVVTTDDLPLGSAQSGAASAGGSGDRSAYPTSPGHGRMGSGATGAPTGPSREPALGIGR